MPAATNIKSYFFEVPLESELVKIALGANNNTHIYLFTKRPEKKAKIDLCRSTSCELESNHKGKASFKKL